MRAGEDGGGVEGPGEPPTGAESAVAVVDETVDVLVLADVPEDVRMAVAGLEFGEGRGFILGHPEGRTVAAIVGMRRLDARLSGKAALSWPEMAEGLNHDFQGLGATGDKLRRFCETKLDHALVIPLGFGRAALMRAQGELNAGVVLMNLREEALAAIEKLKEKVGEIEIVEGKDGKKQVLATGPKLSEFTKALKDAGDLTMMLADETARWGMVPEKKAKGPAVEVNLNFAGGGRMGRAMRSAPVDVPFRSDGQPPG